MKPLLSLLTVDVVPSADKENQILQVYFSHNLSSSSNHSDHICKESQNYGVLQGIVRIGRAIFQRLFFDAKRQVHLSPSCEAYAYPQLPASTVLPAQPSSCGSANRPWHTKSASNVLSLMPCQQSTSCSNTPDHALPFHAMLYQALVMLLPFLPSIYTDGTYTPLF